MKRTHLTHFIAFIVITLYLLGMFGEGYAADVDVTLVVNPPDSEEIQAGSGKIVITADASGENLTFTWKLSGPGKLEAEGAAAFYIPPEKIEQTSEFAIVTVTVKEPSGQATIKSVTFTILPGPPKTATPSPEPTPMVKEGMSRGTKVALGLGAVAALGGGIALAAGGGDGDDGGGVSTSVCTPVGGYCWYLSAHYRSCEQVCASYGGYHEATRTFAGSDGTDSNCWAVLSALGAPADTDGVVSTDSNPYLPLGCCYYYESEEQEVVWIRYTAPTQPAVSSWDYRACACNR
jgi:hypothetical protein